jgi:hypothetical protein
MSFILSSSHINARITASNLGSGSGGGGSGSGSGQGGSGGAAGLPAINETVDIPNIMKAKFGYLKESKDAFPGEPTHCQECKAILTSISKLSEPNRNTGKRTWACEYCHFENKLMISNDEIPSGEVTYLLVPAPPQNEYNTEYTNYFVFCVDISGSMSELAKVKIL